MSDVFIMIRPLIEFNAEQIMQRTNNVFVFKAILPLSKMHKARKINLSYTNNVRQAMTCSIAPTLSRLTRWRMKLGKIKRTKTPCS